MDYEHVQVGKVYRHFKGNYYFVENIGLDSETAERMVIYKALYPREDCSIWIRPEKLFTSILPDRPDNVTGQKHRFELVAEISKDYCKK